MAYISEEAFHFRYRYNIGIPYLLHVCPRVLYHRYILCRYLIVHNIPARCTDRKICVYNTYYCYIIIIIIIESYGRVVTQRSIDNIDVILFGTY